METDQAAGCLLNRSQYALKFQVEVVGCLCRGNLLFLAQHLICKGEGLFLWGAVAM